MLLNRLVLLTLLVSQLSYAGWDFDRSGGKIVPPSKFAVLRESLSRYVDLADEKCNTTELAAELNSSFGLQKLATELPNEETRAEFLKQIKEIETNRLSKFEQSCLRDAFAKADKIESDAKEIFQRAFGIL